MTDDVSQQILKKLDDLGQDVKVLRNDVQKTKTDVSLLSFRASTLDDRIKATQVDLGDIKDGVKRLEVLQEDTDSKIDALSESIGEFMEKATVTALESSSHKETLDFHENRIAYLEKKAA